MIDIGRKKQQAINDFYETHCEAPHEIDLLFGFDSGYNLGLDERDALAAQVERLREHLESLTYSLRDLIDESDGVSGLHQNGNIALWSDLLAGGTFEEWLISYNEALECLRTTNKSGVNNESI